MSKRVSGLLAGVMLWLGSGFAQAGEAPRVAVSIKPIHALVAGVMGGVGEPALLVPGGASPHGHAMRPSEARALHGADIVFWIGHELESFLERPLAGVAETTRVVALSEIDGIEPLAFREGDVGAKHEGHDHDHHVHEDGARDMHLWLDPTNAEVMLRHIVDRLGVFDPANKAAYEANGSVIGLRLKQLDQHLRRQLAPLAARPYVVFHDAYQYLERRYGLRPLASITVHPERRPGAATVRDVRRAIREDGAVCVFTEPQFRPAVIETLVAGTGVKLGELDPMGAAVPPGPEAYFTMMRDLSRALTGCLAPAG